MSELNTWGCNVEDALSTFRCTALVTDGGVEQLRGHPRILGADSVHGRQRVESAKGDVPEVADRSGNNVEAGRKAGIDPEQTRRRAFAQGRVALSGIIVRPSFPDLRVQGLGRVYRRILRRGRACHPELGSVSLALRPR